MAEERDAQGGVQLAHPLARAYRARMSETKTRRPIGEDLVGWFRDRIRMLLRIEQESDINLTWGFLRGDRVVRQVQRKVEGAWFGLLPAELATLANNGLVHDEGCWKVEDEAPKPRTGATYQDLVNQIAAEVNPGAEPPKIRLPMGLTSPIDVTVERFDAPPRKICSFVPVDPSEPIRPLPPMPEDPDGVVREVRTQAAADRLFPAAFERKDLPVPLDRRGVVLTAEITAPVSGADWDLAQAALDEASLCLQRQGVPATWLLLPHGMKPLVLAPDPRLTELATRPLRHVRFEGPIDEIEIPVAPPTYEQLGKLGEPADLTGWHAPNHGRPPPNPLEAFVAAHPGADPTSDPDTLAYINQKRAELGVPILVPAQPWKIRGVDDPDPLDALKARVTVTEPGSNVVRLVHPTRETRSPCASGHPEDETCELCRGVQIDGQGAEPARDGKDFDPPS